MAAGVEALAANGPRPELADKLRLFGQFIGDWDLEVTNHRPDGTKVVVPGEWHFGWVLDGRAVQDVWIAPNRAERLRDPNASGEYGTTIRFYDASIDAWRSTWIGPERGNVLAFVGRKVGEEIVLEGQFVPNEITRWIFFDIGTTSFCWRAVESNDGGKTWKLLQEMKAIRRGGVPK